MPAGLARDVIGAEVQPDRPLMESGLDSLGAVELRNAIAAAFSLPVPATITFDHPTLRLMAQHLSARIQPREAPAAGAAEGGFGYEHVLACVLEASADVLQAPLSPDQPFMEVSCPGRSGVRGIVSQRG